MTTPASIGKHPIHPMVIPFPIALWIFSFICDVVSALHSGSALWKDMAFFSMAGCLIWSIGCSRSRVSRLSLIGLGGCTEDRLAAHAYQSLRPRPVCYQSVAAQGQRGGWSLASGPFAHRRCQARHIRLAWRRTCLCAWCGRGGADNKHRLK